MPQYTWLSYLRSRLNALWYKIDCLPEDDDYHLILWMRLAERLEIHVRREEQRCERTI